MKLNDGLDYLIKTPRAREFLRIMRDKNSPIYSVIDVLLPCCILDPRSNNVLNVKKGADSWEPLSEFEEALEEDIVLDKMSQVNLVRKTECKEDIPRNYVFPVKYSLTKEGRNIINFFDNWYYPPISSH